MIVVPTSNDVVLGQRTQPIEWFAVVLTIAGVGFAVGLAVWARRRRQPADTAAVGQGVSD